MTATIAPHLTLPLGVIWLPTQSDFSINPAPANTADFLNSIGARFANPSWRLFNTSADIKAMVEKDRPKDWIILLDSHTAFHEMTDLMCNLRTRIPELLGQQSQCDKWRATIAVCSPLYASYPSATPAPMSTDDDRPVERAESSFRRNEFYFQVFAGYQWAEVVLANRLQGFLMRATQHRHLLRITSTELKDWQEDIERLWRALGTELGRWDPRSKVGSKCNFRRFFVLLSRIYVLGRWNKSSAEEFLSSTERDSIEEPHPASASDNEGLERLLKIKGAYSLKDILSGLHKEAWTDIMINGDIPFEFITSDNLIGIHRLQTRCAWTAKLIETAADIEIFGTLRDVAQCLTRGTARWADTSREIRDGVLQPIRVLAIKDTATEDFKKTLRSVFSSAFRSGHLRLDCLSSKDTGWNRPDWWIQKIERGKPLEVDLEFPTSIDSAETNTADSFIREYDIIILDVEYNTQFLGAQLIQWLDAQFEESAKRCQEANPNTRIRRPYIFVLTRLAHPWYMHQCMNHGAEGFISKSRLFSLPQHLTSARVGKKRLQVEPRNSKPNFRTLYSLLPRAINRLRSDQTEDMILGEQYDRPWVSAIPKADLHFHIGTSISHQTVEALALNTSGYFFQGAANDQSWQVAKAQTAEGADALVKNVCRIVVLANVLVDWPDIPPAQRLGPAEAVWTAARYVLLPRKAQGQVVDPTPPLMDIFDQVVDWLTPKDKPNSKFETCSLLVAALAIFEKLISNFKSTPVLLEPIRRLAGGGSSKPDEIAKVAKDAGDPIAIEFQNRWHYFDRQAEHFPVQPEERSSTSGIPLQISGPLGCELGVMLDYYTRRVRANWHDVYTEDRVVISSPNPVRPPKTIWEEFSGQVKERVKVSAHKLVSMFTELLLDKRWHAEEQEEFETSQAKPVLPANVVDAIAATFGNGEILAGFVDSGAPRSFKSPLTLQQLVVIPDTINPRHRTLPRYLWGAGLLGAEHLQYPENLLLATWDVVRQNVADNIVYSEIRCSTNGYCDGGMNVYDATDLLCLGFDLAALYHGILEPSERKDYGIPRRWVRTNVLLGAKRHKRLSETQDLIALLRSYIRRGVEVRIEANNVLRRPDVLPGQWWSRCRVVGFDLSGDETNQNTAVQKDLEKVVDPLFVDCTPITIHAGEAATADSIWHAVHRYGAQRIGHGLRLRENKRLLTHCVNRGICMELCPISNDFTNIFDTVRGPGEGGRGFVDAPLGRREIYPLRYFLDAGLDACLNTDNRFLHKESSLTDEYLKAAKLVGGLTRWEILKVSKAGFKNAFLPKDEKAVLLRHVEFEVYKLATDEPGELDFPPPGEANQ